MKFLNITAICFLIGSFGLFFFLIFKFGNFDIFSSSFVQVQLESVRGLTPNSKVMMHGVNVGSVVKIGLDENGNVLIKMKIKSKILIYYGTVFKVRNSGFFGEQIVDIIPSKNKSTLAPKDYIFKGEKTLSLTDTLSDKDAGITWENIQKIIDNIKIFTTALLDVDIQKINTSIELISQGSAHLSASLLAIQNIIKNNEGRVENMLVNLDLTLIDLRLSIKRFSEGKGALGKLINNHQIATQVEQIFGSMMNISKNMSSFSKKINHNEGLLNTVLNDKIVGKNFSQIVSNIKDTSKSVNSLLDKIRTVRFYWNPRVRYSFASNTLYPDFGLMVGIADNKYYRFMVHNLAQDDYTEPDKENRYVNDYNYEKKLNITATIGYKGTFLTTEIGLIQSAFGFGMHIFPFQLWDNNPIRSKIFRIETYISDFTRQEYKGNPNTRRYFDSPAVITRFVVDIKQQFQFGLEINDVLEIQQPNIFMNVLFNDKDIGYLLGLTSLSAFLKK